jgi:hypothetical protein
MAGTGAMGTACGGRRRGGGIGCHRRGKYPDKSASHDGPPCDHTENERDRAWLRVVGAGVASGWLLPGPTNSSARPAAVTPRPPPGATTAAACVGSVFKAADTMRRFAAMTRDVTAATQRPRSACHGRPCPRCRCHTQHGPVVRSRRLNSLSSPGSSDRQRDAANTLMGTRLLEPEKRGGACCNEPRWVQIDR